MSFFKRMLTRIGIGSAKVDAMLSDDEYAPGDVIEGVVKITGGNIEQEIDGLYFSIHSTYKAIVIHQDKEGVEEEREVTRTALLGKTKVSDHFIIAPEGEEEIPFSIQLPYYAPLTVGETKVWINTGLDVKKALDSGDKDYIEVEPEEMLKAIFDALRELGFEMMTAECEEIPTESADDIPFIQAFIFKPAHGFFADRIDELEMVFYVEEDAVETYMEIDRRTRGRARFFHQLMNEEEARVKYTFVYDDIDKYSDILREILESWC